MKLIRCNRFVAVGLALLLLGGCSTPTDIPASSSSEVSLSASSGVSSGALSSLQRDADGVLVIPPEMFDRENATAFPSQQSPNLWEIDFPIHYAKMYLQYYFGPYNLPIDDFCTSSEADPLYLAGTALDYVIWGALQIPSPFYGPDQVKNESEAYRAFREAGLSFDNYRTRDELQASAQTLFGDDFILEDGTYVVENDVSSQIRLAYLPDKELYGFNISWSGLYYHYPCIVRGSQTADLLHCTVALCKEDAGSVPYYSIYYLEWGDRQIFYSDRYADIFKAALLEGESYELTLTQADSDHRFVLHSLHRLTDVEKSALKREALA